MRSYRVVIRPVTPIWTGNENRKNEEIPRETGILGSIRWWYEAFIRSKGGSACHPTTGDKKCNEKHHCDVCELFGCTGWSRKFRLSITKEEENIVLTFIELRPIQDIEWALLNKCLEIMQKHGAIGGKLADPNYGLFEIVSNELGGFSLDGKDEIVRQYLVRNNDWPTCPNISHFIFVNQQQLEEHLKKNFNLEDRCTFLKGSPGKGKTYFFKKDDKEANRYFAYAETKENYEKLIDEMKHLPFTKGSDLK